ncbi:hypothetical protein GCM10027436_66220 [Actinophytocola sediminis]
MTAQERHDAFTNPAFPPVWQPERGTFLYTGHNGVRLVVAQDGTIITDWHPRDFQGRGRGGGGRGGGGYQ